MLVSRIAMREWILPSSSKVAWSFTRCGRSGDRAGRRSV